MLAVASQLSVDEVLQRLVDCARELAGARYAALGIPDGEGGFRRFLVSGMSDELIAAMGPLPRTHGMLGAMLDGRRRRTAPTTSTTTRASAAGGRARHPDMRSFLGVPIVAADEVIGAFYLTEKRGRARRSTPSDQAADRAARRARRDRDHQRAPVRAQPRAVDPVRAQPARARAPRRRQPEAVQPDARPPRPRRRSSTAIPTPRALSSSGCGELAREALDELRSLILGLRPPELERDGLEGALRKEVEMLAPRPRRRDRARSTRRRRPAGERRRRRARARGAADRRTRRCTTRVRHARAEHVIVRLPSAAARSASRSPTTASASIPTAPSCARATSG